MTRDAALELLGFSKQFINHLNEFDASVAELSDTSFTDDAFIAADLTADTTVNDSQTQLIDHLVVKVPKVRPQRRITSG